MNRSDLSQRWKRTFGLAALALGSAVMYASWGRLQFFRTRPDTLCSSFSGYWQPTFRPDLTIDFYGSCPPHTQGDLLLLLLTLSGLGLLVKGHALFRTETPL